MSTRLPPLNALRVFEVAARHLSFTAAARELNVTNAAISHQVKQLEQTLDLQLFTRRNNRLELTVAGETYLPKVREAFRTLRESTDRLIGFTSVTVRVAVRPGFCHRWLVPRLPRFYEHHPGIHLEFETEVDRDYLRHDVTVDYRPANAPDYVVQQLFATSLYPVCSPSYRHRVSKVEDLEHIALLHDRPLQGMPEYPDWQRWLTAAGVGIAAVSNTHGATFSSSLMCMQAAEDGVGVALGQHALIAPAIASGRLMAPLSLSAPIRLPYYLVYSVSAVENPGGQPFIDWLHAEAARGTSVDVPLA